MRNRAVIGIVTYDDLVLIGKKKEYPKKYYSGKWHIPGESLEDRETFEIALLRGIKEETGLEVKIVRLLASCVSPTGADARWYECMAFGLDISPGGDLSEVKWVKKKNIFYELDRKAISSFPKEINEYFRL